MEYNGSSYHGWQVQKNAPSIQEKLEAALERLTGNRMRVRGAGRTDSGVHARGQTAAFPLPDSIPLQNIPAALNTRLPADIAVVDACEAAADFDPRRHCLLKQYSYSFTSGPIRPALGSRHSWHVKWPLEWERMRWAAHRFLGTHDFTSFCNQELAGRDNVRTVDRCELVTLPPDPAGRLRHVLYVEGKSFLYNMVRAIAGTLVGVGTGRFSPEDINAILNARERAKAGQSAPACGLCLEWTLYDGDSRPDDRGGLF